MATWIIIGLLLLGVLGIASHPVSAPPAMHLDYPEDTTDHD